MHWSLHWINAVAAFLGPWYGMWYLQTDPGGGIIALVFAATAFMKITSFFLMCEQLREEYGDMFAAGVVDPLKVTRTALENAISVAATLMTTDCLIVEAETDDKTNADSQFEGDF